MFHEEIGEAAGLVYEHLKTKGERTLTQLQKEVPAKRQSLVLLAVGWLAREGKIRENRVGSTVRLGLAD
jgi:hypothetical protein